MSSAERIRVLVRSPTDPDHVTEVASEELAPWLGDGRLAAWIDISHPGDRAAVLLRDVLRLGPLAVEDCLTPQRMPQYDFLPDGEAFLAVFAVHLDGEDAGEEGDGPRLRPLEVDFVVGRGYLVTVVDPRVGDVPPAAPVAAPEPAAALEARVTARLRTEPADAGRGGAIGAALAGAALDALVDSHLPALVRAAAAAERLEDRLDPLAESVSLAALDRLIVLRRDLLAFRRQAVAQQEVLARLARLAPELGAALSDMGDTEREALALVDATRDYIDGAVEAYRIRRDERTAGDVRRLTVLATVLGAVSVLSGLWGVNFRDIPGTEHPLGFPVFVAVQVTLVLLAVRYLRRRRLL